MARFLSHLVVLVAITPGYAQLLLDQGSYTKVIVPKGVQAFVAIVDIRIDTLVMEDKSSMEFSFPLHSMLVKQAYLHGSVSWKGVGRPGIDAGTRGAHGVDLTLHIDFYELGRLVIDTRGGAGANGVSPKARRGYVNISSPGNGGKGGNGGTIRLSYRCQGFTPRFDKGSKEAIHFKVKGGPGGMGGYRNEEGSSPQISAGPQGDRGANGVDGEIVLQERN